MVKFLYIHLIIISCWPQQYATHNAQLFANDQPPNFGLPFSQRCTLGGLKLFIGGMLFQITFQLSKMVYILFALNLMSLIFMVS